MRHLLLTNDDGVDSPAPPPFAHALQDLGDVTVVVPDRQRSWIGKAISRAARRPTSGRRMPEAVAVSEKLRARVEHGRAGG